MSREAPEAGLRGDRERWPLLTVVVPVRNEGPFIGSTLEQILAQNYPRERLEILVVDGGSTDSTRQTVLRLARSHSRRARHRHYFRGMNSGATVVFVAATAISIHGHALS